MDLETLIKNFIPIIQTIIYFVGLLSILVLFIQIHITTKWNRLSTSYNSFSIDVIEKINVSFIQTLKKFKIKLNNKVRSITPDQAEKIYNDEEARISLNSALSLLDNICTGYIKGCLDKKYIYAISYKYMPMIYMIFKPYINFYRESCKDNHICLYFENFALECLANEKLQKKELKKIKKFENKIKENTEKIKKAQRLE